MSKDARKALMIAKGPVSSGYLPPGHPEREANLARYMKGANKQVFNKDKSPKTFYHGTTVPEDFSEFSVGSPIHTEDEHGESHRRIYTHNDPTTYLGSHFAEEPEIANEFGKGLYGEAKGAQEGNRVLPVHLSIKKPHVTTETDMLRSMLRDTYDHPAVSARLQNEEEEKRYDDPKELDFRTRVNKFAWKLSSNETEYNDDSFAEKMAEQYRNRLINAGFDGIKYHNEVEGGNSWVAFHPTQIKSAVGNNGQYDPNEPEINKAEGGEVDVQYDNPGGNWLKHQREDAEATVQKRGNIGAAGALTAWSKPVHVDPAKLSKIPGSMNERPEPGNAKYDALHKSMSAEGYSNKSPLLVGINHRGEPHIIEGNNRAAVARDLGVKSIPVEFRWFAGGEQADGFKPEHIKSLMPDITKAEGGAVEETVPEAPHTLESQLQAFLQGKRKAVLYTHEEPAPPEGAQRLETAHGVFHYNPALIDERSIKAAVAGDRINEILGYGPYSKRDVLNRVTAGDAPLAVVGRDAEGREVVAAAGTHGTANEQASAIAAQLPTGGQVHIESPQQVISERIAALRSPEQGNKDARKALMVAKARGGSIEDEAIKAALKRVASPFSRSPEMRQHANRIASSLKVPQGGEVGVGSYYGVKQPVDVRDIAATVGPIPGVDPLQPKKMSWEDFHTIGKGGTLINIGGDRSNLGRLTHIQGQPLAWPVDLHAGPGYMLEPNPGQVWANNPSHASALKKKILTAAEKGPVFGAYAPMGSQAVDSSHNMFDALMAQVPGSGISKKAAKEFDQAIRTGQHVKGNADKDVSKRTSAVEYLQDWPGILNAKASSEFAKTLPGSHRSDIVKFMDSKKWRDEGFPGVGMTRVSITDPDVRGAAGNMLGHRIVKFSPDDFSEKNQTFQHSTYTSPTTGSYVGDVPLVQRQYAMPDVTDAMLLKPAAGDRIIHPFSVDPLGRSTARKLFEEQKQLQPINQRMLDSVQQGLEKQPDYGFAAGGTVDDDPNRELDNSGFYNAAAEAAQGIPQAKGTPQQMMSMVQKAPGTQETMKWSGADQAFAGQPIVSKDDLVKHFQTNAPKLEETQLGGRQSNMATKYHQYTIPGGENYREVLLKTPVANLDKLNLLRQQRDDLSRKSVDAMADWKQTSEENAPGHPATLEAYQRVNDARSALGSVEEELKSLVKNVNENNYNSSHWTGHPNIVAHLRMSDRTLPQTGEKALHLEELQSDWGQAGREGFKKSPEELAAMKADMLAAHKDYLALHGAGAPSDQIQAAEGKYNAAMDKWGKASKVTTPEGPYVGNTAKWTELGLKRALIEAARNGHDKLIWTPGEDQADRYDLSRQVSHIDYNKHGPDEYRLGIVDKDGSGVDLPKDVYKASELPSVVGKEVANKIINGEGQAGGNRMTLRGLDLKVGGVGMKGYYDKIVPTALARIVKSIGHTPEFGTDYIKGKTYDADLDVYKHAVTGKYHVATGDKRDDPDAEDMEAGPFNTHGEAVAHRDLLYKGLKAVPSLKITPAMRETISKGLPRKTGGFVPPARSSAVEQALKLTSKSGATLPAAVFLARQHQSRN